MAANLLHLKATPKELAKVARHAFGHLSADEKDYVPESERPKIVLVARIWLLILAVVILASIALQSWMPLMFVGLPTFYGSWLHHVMAATQHAGLAEDVADHRLNSRTVYLNPVLRFVYSNMNYHIEHHMYPLVPFHALPTLHEEIEHDLPRTYTSLWDAYREIIPALWRQTRDPTHFVRRELRRPAQAA